MNSHSFFVLHTLTLIYSWTSIARDAREKKGIVRICIFRVFKSVIKKDIITEFEPTYCFGVWILQRTQTYYTHCVCNLFKLGL